MSEPSVADWTTVSVKREDGSVWLGLAYISDGEREYGSFNEQQAIAVCTAHNAEIAKLRADNERLQSASNHMAACRALLNVPDDEVLYQAIKALSPPSEA